VRQEQGSLTVRALSSQPPVEYESAAQLHKEAALHPSGIGVQVYSQESVAVPLSGGGVP